MATSLLKTKRFFPLLITQFLGALNDNMFKNALLTLVTLKMTSQSDILSNIIAGLFILPFFLFSATAGQIADKYPRDKIARILKITEIVLMLGVGLAYYLGNLYLLIAILALMGAQSAFFGPVKYALLPQQLESKELIAGNAYIESTTYAAILLGLIFGTLLPTQTTIILLICLAVLGYFASSFIPYAPAPRPDSIVQKNILASTYSTLSFIKKHKLIFTCILGASWFWVIGALIVVQVYPLAGKIINATEGVITFFLVTFSVGVAVGSFFCNKILKGFIHATYVPLSAIGMGVSLFLLYFYTNNYPTPETITSFIGFFSLPHAFAISLNLFLLAFWGGLYIIPLNAMMQSRAPKAYVATVIAGNNIYNALGMVLVAVFAVVFLSLGFTIPELFLTLAVLSILVSFYICILLPDALTRSLVQALLGFLFKSKVTGLTNFKRAGKRVLILSNHVSLLDGVLLAAFMPERITFAINTEWTKKWFMPITRLLVDFYPVDPTNPLSIRALIEEVKKGRKVMMFPEGRVTVTGAMMKVYEGAGIIAAKANAKILPVRINGAEYSKFSYLKNKYKTRWFPKITLNILEAEKFALPENNRQGRYAVSKKLYNLMTDMMYKTSNNDEDIVTSLKSAAAVHGKTRSVIEDLKHRPLNYKNLIKESYCLGEAYKKLFNDKKVGIYLPSSIDALKAFFALQAINKIPVMLDAPSTKYDFITTKEMMKEHEVNQKAVFVDEVKVTLTDKIKACFNKIKLSSKDTAVIFSNHEKEVGLTHNDIESAHRQFGAVFPLNTADVVVNAMPTSNAYGFIYGLISPVLSGSMVFVYPNPKHYKVIPELCYDMRATMIIGNNELFEGYGASAHPYDFFSIKYAVSAGDTLTSETFDLWVKKFGVRILDGYFSKEKGMVISMNTPIYNKQGTLGCLLPGQEKPDNLEKDEEGFLTLKN